MRGFDAENKLNETNFNYGQAKANVNATVIVDELDDGHFYSIYLAAKNSHPKYPRATPDALI